MNSYRQHVRESLRLQGRVAGLLIAIDTCQEKHVNALRQIDAALAWHRDLDGLDEEARDTELRRGWADSVGAIDEILSDDRARIANVKLRLDGVALALARLERVLDDVAEYDLLRLVSQLKDDLRAGLAECARLSDESEGVIGLVHKQMVLLGALAETDTALPSVSPWLQERDA